MTSVSPAHQSLERHEPTPSSSPSLIVTGRSVSAAEHRTILTEIQSKIGPDQNDIYVREMDSESFGRPCRCTTSTGPNLSRVEGHRSLHMPTMELHLPRFLRIPPAQGSQDVARNFRQLRSLNGPFPLLQQLAISPAFDVDFPALLRRAPALREIRLVGERYMSYVTLPSSGFQEIMQPMLSGNSSLMREIHFLDGISRANRSLPPLEKNFPRLTNFMCHIKCIGVEDAMRRERRIYSYPHFHSLSLRGYHSILVLHLLTLPNLRHLGLCSDLDMAVVTSFISRSCCTLQHLHFGAENFEENYFDDEDLHARIEIDACLSTFQSLKTLEFSSCTNLDPWSRCLADPNLFPHLKDIIISAPKSDLDYKALIRMLRRRRRTTDTAKLKSFHLTVRDASEDKFKLEDLFESDESDELEAECSWRPEEPASSELRRLIADGLNFVIRLHNGMLVSSSSLIDQRHNSDLRVQKFYALTIEQIGVFTMFLSTPH
ncbi:hypothetical protein C8R44DRAFT_883358 [Mycena epipterygia]|nr:hypothetical protein C8R44DRAFT_883358 [Mycena epipterygia]